MCVRCGMARWVWERWGSTASTRIIWPFIPVLTQEERTERQEVSGTRSAANGGAHGLAEGWGDGGGGGRAKTTTGSMCACVCMSEGVCARACLQKVTTQKMRISCRLDTNHICELRSAADNCLFFSFMFWIIVDTTVSI